MKQIFRKQILTLLICITSYLIYAGEPIDTDISVIRSYSKDSVLDLTKVDSTMTKSTKLYIYRAQFSLKLFYAGFETCSARFYASAFRIEDSDGGNLVSGNSMFNPGLGFACDNELPYIRVKGDFASIFDLIITDPDQTSPNHRFKGQTTGVEVAVGLRFSGFRVALSIYEPTFTFHKQSQNHTFWGLEIAYEM